MQFYTVCFKQRLVDSLAISQSISIFTARQYNAERSTSHIRLYYRLSVAAPYHVKMTQSMHAVFSAG